MAEKKKCFIIMPITTPEELVEIYKGDLDHFKHVLDILFIPAVEKAGFEPISPEASGSEIIQANIIKNLATTDLVLCDMSILNPNVFFELGIRTALDKPVAMVVDDRTKDKTPFDTTNIHRLEYKGSLHSWENEKEIQNLTKHIKTCYAKSKDINALWKFFGISASGSYDPNNADIGQKLDLIFNYLQNSNDISSKRISQLAVAATEGLYRPAISRGGHITKDLFSEFAEIPDANTGWVCPNCSKVHPPQITVCPCGFVRE